MLVLAGRGKSFAAGTGDGDPQSLPRGFGEAISIFISLFQAGKQKRNRARLSQRKAVKPDSLNNSDENHNPHRTYDSEPRLYTHNLPEAWEGSAHLLDWVFITLVFRLPLGTQNAALNLTRVSTAYLKTGFPNQSSTASTPPSHSTLCPPSTKGAQDHSGAKGRSVLR